MDQDLGPQKQLNTHKQKAWLSSISSEREIGTLVDTELRVSHWGKVASRDADAVSTSL